MYGNNSEAISWYYYFIINWRLIYRVKNESALVLVSYIFEYNIYFLQVFGHILSIVLRGS